MIEQVGCDAPKKLFFRVAKEMFADGTFNWGRVVALFYFACKLVLKALCTKVPELVQTILRWTMEYLQEHVLAWIQAQGGWVRPQIPLRGVGGPHPPFTPPQPPLFWKSLVSPRRGGGWGGKATPSPSPHGALGGGVTGNHSSQKNGWALPCFSP
uniref:BCL2 associated X, apoptosis regulator n=1 Tax=Taeniopygia guttata TaxID=59729 RepID=A0A674HSA7_TAEGU